MSLISISSLKEQSGEVPLIAAVNAVETLTLALVLAGIVTAISTGRSAKAGASRPQ